MTPEQKFNNNVWSVLQKVREKSLYTKKGDLLEFWVEFGFYTKSSGQEIQGILEKLEEWGAIKIHDKGGSWEHV